MDVFFVSLPIHYNLIVLTRKHISRGLASVDPSQHLCFLSAGVHLCSFSLVFLVLSLSLSLSLYVFPLKYRHPYHLTKRSQGNCQYDETQQPHRHWYG